MKNRKSVIVSGAMMAALAAGLMNSQADIQAKEPEPVKDREAGDSARFQNILEQAASKAQEAKDAADKAAVSLQEAKAQADAKAQVQKDAADALSKAQEAKENLSALEEAANNDAAALEAANQELADVQAQGEALEAAVNEAQAAFDAANEEYEPIREDVEAILEAGNEPDEESKAIYEAFEAADENLKGVQEELAAWQQLLNDKQQAQVKAEEQSAASQKALEEANKLADSIDQLQADANKADQDLADANASVDKLQAEYNALQAAADQAKEDLEIVEEQFESETVNEEQVANGWNSDKTSYFVDGKALVGEQLIDGVRYVFDANGKKMTGLVTLDSTLTNDGNKTVYLDGNGAMQFGQIQIGGNWKCFDLTTGAMKTGLVDLSVEYNQDGAKTVYYDEEGNMRYGSVKVGDHYRYFDLRTGALIKNQEIEIDNNVYFYDENGIRYYGEYKNGTNWRYYDVTTGILAKGGFFEVPGGKRIYADAQGNYVRGWLDLDGKTYYFDPSTGYQLTNFKRIDGKNYFFDDATGAMLKSHFRYFANLNGSERTVYFGYKGYMLYGLQTINNNTYGFDMSTGNILRGEVTLSSDYTGGAPRTVYFDVDSGAMAKNGFFEVKDDKGDIVKKVYADGTGSLVKGWLELGGKTYYFDKTTGAQLVDFKRIDGKNYYFDKTTGAMVTSRFMYFANLNGTPRNVYFGYKGHMVYGLQNIAGNTYAFDLSTGNMIKGLVHLTTDYSPSGAKTVYFDDETGRMLFGEHTINGKRYKFQEGTGVIYTKWIFTENGKQYGFDFHTQNKLSGIQTVHSQVRYFNPDKNNELSIGLTYIKDGQDSYGARYAFFNNEGAMFYGPRTFNENVTASNGKVFTKGQKYFEAKSGAMAVSKMVKHSDTEAYVYDANGNKIFSNQTVGGVRYEVNSQTGLVQTIDGVPFIKLPAHIYRYQGNTLFFTWKGMTFTAERGSKLERLLVAAAPVLSNPNFRFQSGGRMNENGLDCIGFVMYCYNNAFGLNLNAKSVNEFRYKGYGYDISAPADGDIVLFQGTHSGPSIYSHSSIYLGGGYVMYATYTGIEISQAGGIWADTIGGPAPQTYYRIPV